MLSKLSLKQRLALIIVGAIVGYAALSVLFILRMRSMEMAAYKLQSASAVEIAHSVADFYHKEVLDGRLTEAEGKRMALTSLESMRYGAGEYFYIYDTRGYGVMHPYRKDIIGKDVSDMADPNGTPVVKGLLKAAAEARGVGFHEVEFAKPNQEGTYPKVLSVILFRPWGWAIGSGVYVDEVDKVVATAVANSLVFLLIAVAAVTLLSYFVARSITRQLGGEPRYAAEVIQQASKGDFTVELVAGRGDPLSLVSRFKSLLGKLRTTFLTLDKNAGRIYSNTTEIANHIDDVRKETNQAFDRIEAVAGSVEQMAANCRVISENVQKSEGLSRQVFDLVENSHGTLTASTEGIGKVGRLIAESGQQIAVLSSQVQEVGHTVGLIQEIAGQTNLLALNAAIEAARAGDQGRGFSVVAGEVGNLAERTAQATVQIESVIASVKKGTDEVVESVRAAIPQIEHCAKVIAGVADIMSQVRNSAKSSLQMVAGITESMTEQSEASARISSKMIDFVGSMEGINRSVEETNRATQDLNYVAKILYDETTKFKY